MQVLRNPCYCTLYQFVQKDKVNSKALTRARHSCFYLLGEQPLADGHRVVLDLLLCSPPAPILLYLSPAGRALPNVHITMGLLHCSLPRSTHPANPDYALIKF